MLDRLRFLLAPPTPASRRKGWTGAVLVAASLALVPACAPMSENETDPQAEVPAPAYVGRFRDQGHEIPDTSDVGAFFIRSGCLVFVSDSGTSYLPILPGTAELSRSPSRGWQLRVGGRVVSEGRNYNVVGGEGQYGWLDPPPPPGCPARHFLIGEVR